MPNLPDAVLQFSARSILWPPFLNPPSPNFAACMFLDMWHAHGAWLLKQGLPSWRKLTTRLPATVRYQ